MCANASVEDLLVGVASGEPHRLPVDRPLRGHPQHLARPETFCSGEGVQFARRAAQMREAALSFLSMDAPRHTKLRKLVSATFTPRQIGRIEDAIKASAARRIVRRGRDDRGR